MELISGPFPGIAPQPAHLSRPAMQQLVGRALLDPGFCTRLLNGSRAQILSKVDALTDDERAFLMTVRADTLGEFASAITGQYGPDHGRLAEAPPAVWAFSS